MQTMAFWNNKGGTGKTSLAFQTVCEFARINQDQRILVIDVCPQANLSELFLGGQENGGGKSLIEIQGGGVRSTVGGYFQLRLPRPYESGDFEPNNFIVSARKWNELIPSNIDLVCGDPLLELQANAMSTLANNQIPGTNTWIKIVSWLVDFINSLTDEYDYVFIDTNPSFSIYTQIALAAAERLVLPVMADDSSRRGIQNAFSLVYGMKLPSEIYAQHMFATKMAEGNMPMPKVHLIVKNRLTQYMGPASGYAAVLTAIDNDLAEIIRDRPETLTFKDVHTGVAEVRDFQTTGVVAFARGVPFHALKAGKLAVGDKRVTVNAPYLDNCKRAVSEVAKKLW